MKKVRNAVLFFLGFLLLQTAQSQNALHIEFASGPMPPAFIAIGDSFSFNVLVRNDSATTFHGNINFAYRIDTLQLSGSNSASGFEFFTTTDSIQPGDSVVKLITAHVTNPAFKVGPSVVVIWPIAAASFAEDSLVFSIQVTPATGIDKTSSEQWRVFVNENSLQIINSEIQLKRVRIFDIIGNEILDKQNPASNIPLPEMSAGIYLAEIIYNNNLKKVFKFYR